MRKLFVLLSALTLVATPYAYATTTETTQETTQPQDQLITFNLNGVAYEIAVFKDDEVIIDDYATPAKEGHVWLALEVLATNTSDASAKFDPSIFRVKLADVGHPQTNFTSDPSDDIQAIPHGSTLEANVRYEIKEEVADASDLILEIYVDGESVETFNLADYIKER